MKLEQEELLQLLADPVTLGMGNIDGTDLSANYLNFRVGAISNKNEQEIEHFRKSFSPIAPNEKSYTRRIRSLPQPTTDEDSIILDIGCGPYDCISTIPGKHLFLDDIMNHYIDELSASLDGTMICARTELMPFADEVIDVLYSVNMIDHVDDMPESIAEMYRVLKPSGKIYLQSYFNSHPLLETEPGVFDACYLNDFVTQYFDVEYLQTFAVGDPSISASYTMDIICCVLTKKTGLQIRRKDRRRYLDTDYLGPQSCISLAIRALETGVAEDAAPHVEALADEPFYDTQFKLLTAWIDILEGDLGSANTALKKMLTMERIRKNPFARIAVMQMENRRILASL